MKTREKVKKNIEEATHCYAGQKKGEVGTAKDRVAEAASYFQENYKTLLETNG